MLKPFLALSLAVVVISSLQAQSNPDINRATLGEVNPKTPELSTDELRRLLAEDVATVFDVRPHMEFAISHIPGAVNVAQKPGSSKALYVSDVAEVGRLLNGRKDGAVVLYCNGPFCGKGKRLAEELLAAGYTNVRRYQLGIPVWRALGGVTQIEAQGARYVKRNDRTSVWLDTRPIEQFQKGSLAGAKRIGIEVTQGGKDNPPMQRAKKTEHCRWRTTIPGSSFSGTTYKQCAALPIHLPKRPFTTFPFSQVRTQS